jgi:isoleucyl-tRNA synthetase
MTFMLITNQTKAARAISEFVQENLSNWYVLFVQKTILEGEYEREIKLLLSNTLYLLAVVANCRRQSLFFFSMDKLYRDLTQATKQQNLSVHLAKFPLG